MAIQGAIDYAYYTTKINNVYIPQGKYRITNTLNLTFIHNINIVFQNRSSEYELGTLLVGETGTKPVIETSGSDGTTVTNCGIIAGTTNPSTLGILQARPNGGFWVGRHKYENLFIRLGSDINANGGVGTIGFFNIAGEECEYCNVEIWANVCFVSSNSKNIRTSKIPTTNNPNPGFNYYTVVSSFVPFLHESGSNTIYTFSGTNRFVSWDYFSPAIWISEAGNFDLGHSYFLKRLPQGVSTPSGNYTYAIECWNCWVFTHHGSIEGCGNYMLLRRDLLQADIRIRIDETEISDQPILLLMSDGGNYKILNSTISISANNQNSRLISYNSNLGGNPHQITNSSIFETRNYNVNYVESALVTQSKNSNFYFADNKIQSP